MKRSLITLFAVSVVMLVTLARCGNNSSNSNPPPAVLAPAPCAPGQICLNGGGGLPAGTYPIINAPAAGRLDDGGAFVITGLGGSGVGGRSGQAYIVGQMILLSGCYGMPPGTYTFQGTGQWLGDINYVSGAVLQITGGQPSQQYGYPGYGGGFAGGSFSAPSLAIELHPNPLVPQANAPYTVTGPLNGLPCGPNTAR